METIDSLLGKLIAGDDAEAETAAAGLARYDQAALGALRQLAGASQADHRWWALRTLAEISDPQIPEILTEALEDPDPTVRQCAALGLRQQPGHRAIPALLAMLDAADSLTADLAADALVAVGEPAVESLLDVLAEGQQQARLRAAKALALIGDTRAIPALFHVLDEDSAILDYWASEGLDRMGIGMTFFKP